MTCRVCGGTEAHREGCPVGRSQRARRARAAAAVNSLGAVVSLRDLEVDFDNAEQASACAAVQLAYDEATGLILRGIYRGMQVRDAVAMEVGHLLKTHRHVRARYGTCRPWWNWWRPTPSVTLTPARFREVPT